MITLIGHPELFGMYYCYSLTWLLYKCLVITFVGTYKILVKMCNIIIVCRMYTLATDF